MTSLLRLEVSVPMPSAASSTTTSRPASANPRATANPTTPAPITMQSIRSMDLPGKGRECRGHARAGSSGVRVCRCSAGRGFARRRGWLKGPAVAVKPNGRPPGAPSTGVGTGGHSAVSSVCAVLARVDGEGLGVVRQGHYAEMVGEQRKQRALERRAPIDWIVMRNRLSALDARNKRDIQRALETLAQRIGFRLAPGFGERVIFRELFLKGLTLLDLREPAAGGGLTMSHLAARH